MDLSRCRICLYKVEAENSKSVFAAAKDGQLISEILSRFASVQIRTSDGLPSSICNNCEEKVNILIDFRAEIRRSDSTLRSSCNVDETKIFCSSIDIKDEWSYTDDAIPTINYENEIEDEDQSYTSLAECSNSADNSDPLALTNFCEVCGKKFSDQKVLMKHKEFHDDAMPFKCYECETGYSQQCTLLDHNRICHSETGYKCHVAESDESTPPQVRKTAQKVISELLPEKSKSRYEAQFNRFVQWCDEKQITTYTESVLLAYFTELVSKNKKALWAIYSMIKACILIHKNIDISKYPKLIAYLKKTANYKPKKSRSLGEEHIKAFIDQASDKEYLMMKVILIIGVSGALRREELYNIVLNDIEFKDDIIVITIPGTKTNIICRKFVITNTQWVSIIHKYLEIRLAASRIKDRFFLKYQNGRCVNSAIGIHTIGSTPSKIASFLNLENPRDFTAHCFRRSSATLLADQGGDLLTRKRHLKSGIVSRGNVEDSLKTKIEVAEMITEASTSKKLCTSTCTN